MRRITCTLSFLVLLVGGLAGSQQSDSQRLEDLRHMIEREIGVPYGDEPSQCKLIPFGSKPCGGPLSYLVYSTLRTNESRLKQLVNEYNQLQKKINEERKIASDCALAPVPKVEFAEGLCTAKPFKVAFYSRI